MPASTESQALKEALNKYKLLEADYKQLHEKRLQDVSKITNITLNYSLFSTNLKFYLFSSITKQKKK